MAGPIANVPARYIPGQSLDLRHGITQQEFADMLTAVAKESRQPDTGGEVVVGGAPHLVDLLHGASSHFVVGLPSGESSHFDVGHFVVGENEHELNGFYLSMRHGESSHFVVGLLHGAASHFVVGLPNHDGGTAVDLFPGNGSDQPGNLSAAALPDYYNVWVLETSGSDNPFS